MNIDLILSQYNVSNSFYKNSKNIVSSIKKIPSFNICVYSILNIQYKSTLYI